MSSSWADATRIVIRNGIFEADSSQMFIIILF